jgi:hypothetical protein
MKEVITLSRRDGNVRIGFGNSSQRMICSSFSEAKFGNKTHKVKRTNLLHLSC